MFIDYSPEFARCFKKLPIEVKKEFLVKEKIFRKNPFSVSLKTHKLSGKLSGKFAFSVSYSIRIIFSINKNKDEIRFHSVGGHDMYNKK